MNPKDPTARALSAGAVFHRCALQVNPHHYGGMFRGQEAEGNALSHRPEVIKELAKVLAADPDVLFRLSSSTDPEVIDYLHAQPEVMNLLRYIKEASFIEAEIKSLIQAAESIKANSH